MLTRKFTKDEMIKCREFFAESFESSNELDMWCVCSACTDTFGFIDIQRAFFSEKFDAETFIGCLSDRFNKYEKRHIIYSNISFNNTISSNLYE